MPRKAKEHIFSNIAEINPENLRYGVKYTIDGIRDLELLSWPGNETVILGYTHGSSFQKKVRKDIENARPAEQEIAVSGHGVQKTFFLAKTFGRDLNRTAKEEGFPYAYYYCRKHFDEISTLVYKLSKKC